MHAWQALLRHEDLRVAALRRLHAEHRLRPAFPAEVVSLIDQLDDTGAWRPVWLLCRLAEEGRLSAKELESVVFRVDTSSHWTWRLLVCQLFGRVTCPSPHRQDLVPFLLDCARDRRTIVRAWALTALWRFREDPRYRTDIEPVMAAARRDPAKAMSARVRLLARGDWCGSARTTR